MELEIFYKQLLGIESPWQITKIEIDAKQLFVFVYLGHEKGQQFPCSCCQKACSVYDHQELRTWRHLDTCQYQTHLKAHLPRTHCSDCGVKTVSPSWSSTYSRFTDQFECHAIDVLQASQVMQSSALLLQISTDQISYLMKKSVGRGVARRQAYGEQIAYLAIDEKGYKEGHNYVTILSDADNGRVLEVVEDRTIESVRKCYKALNDNQLAHVKGISMDMWSAFASVSKELAPQADIVHDRFHLSCYLNDAVDITRRAENKKLLQQNNELLKGTKYIWLKNRDNLSPINKELLDTIRLQSALKTVQAFDIKEEFKLFFTAQTTQHATEFFNQWFEKVSASKNAYLLKVAKMFKHHFEGLKNYITHRISNAIAESLNSRIQQIKAKARGFNSSTAFRVAILFHFGKLNLYP